MRRDRSRCDATICGPARCPLGFTNLEGDGQADLKHHGGPDKAVLAYPLDHYGKWREILDLPVGGFGENWTLTGQDEEGVCLGDIYDIGTARVQVSQPRRPCWKLARLWNRPELAKQAQDTGRLGWYFRVLKTGDVRVRDKLMRIERPLPDWSIARMNQLMYHDRHDMEAAAFLAECLLLSASWRESFQQRLNHHPPPDPKLRLVGE